MDEVSRQTVVRIAAAFLEKLSGETADIRISHPVEHIIEVDASLRSPQMLIGRNGQTLEDVQRVMGLAASKALGRRVVLRLDINGYRRNHDAHVAALAVQCANEAVLSGRQKSLPPMSPADRRLAHLALMDRTDVTATSESEGELRHVVVSPIDR